MILTIRWYERNNDFTPNYNKEHHGTIRGNSAAECMMLLTTYRQDHDIEKFTKTEIIYVAD